MFEADKQCFFVVVMQVPLGLLFKNENLNDEIVEILQEVHDNYLPTKKVEMEMEGTATEVLEPIFFGGDQLTEERSRNAQDARGDGDTSFERLEGLIPKVEDWHAIRLVYQVKAQQVVHTMSKLYNLH